MTPYSNLYRIKEELPLQLNNANKGYLVGKPKPFISTYLVIHDVTDPAGRAEAGHHEHALEQRPRTEAGVGAVWLPGDQRHDGERDVLDEHLRRTKTPLVQNVSFVSHS